MCVPDPETLTVVSATLWIVLAQPKSGIRFTNSPLTSFAKLRVLRRERPVQRYRSHERAVLRETRENNTQEITPEIFSSPEAIACTKK